MESQELKHALEALLFASEKPMHLEQIQCAFEEEISTTKIRECLEILRDEYESEGRGFKIFQIAGGYQVATDPRFVDTLKRFYESREKKKLSQGALETLSVVAYKQPVTKADIEWIRGVNVDGVLRTLLERSLVRITGRKEVPGRPMLYGTTKEFLEHFGLNSLEGLPALKEFGLKDLEEHLLPPELKSQPQESQGETA